VATLKIDSVSPDGMREGRVFKRDHK